MNKLLVCVAFFLFGTLAAAGTFQTITLQQNDAFRRDVLQFVQKKATDNKEDKKEDKQLDLKWFNGGSPTFYLIHWSAQVSIYSNGSEVGTGKAIKTSLSQTLNDATESALQNAHLTPEQLKKARFKVTFYYPPDARQYTMINGVNENQVWELIGNVIPVRQMDTALVKSRIQAEKNYLLRMMDPETHAFFKRYNADQDLREPKLRTIYTASTLYTLLKVNSLFPDPLIQQQIKPMVNFILMMQEHSGNNKGAFHYSYDKPTGRKDILFGEGRFVVGTASKAIFTLLLLYDQTHNQKYLNAAKAAGNWLVKKVDKKGHVNPVIERLNGKIVQKTKQSFLYSGQVLSALSRLYAVTDDKAYYNTATDIANRVVDAVQKNGAFVGDAYRAPNSVTTSWVVMSLVDYAKINPAPIYRDTITRCANELVNHQIQAPWDAFNEGRLMDIITTSGNGWVNEVMTVFYPFCKAQKMSGCSAYKRFVIHSSRWLAQNVYTPENMFAIKNPAMAEGGVMRNFADAAVRTDAVCHGLNSLVGLLNIMGTENQALQFLPERPIDEVIGLLEMGGVTAR